MTLEGISQSYHIGDRVIPVLRNISLSLWRGGTCALLGATGSGKSTLLNILGLLDRPASGRFHFAGQDMLNASMDELAAIRNREIGFVFQAFNLLPHLSALDNVALPLTYRGVSRSEAHAHALDQMQRAGLADHAMHRPAELSGGQCQRVAIARALIGAPSVILADEPTGNLDSTTATDDVMDLLLALNRERGYAGSGDARPFGGKATESKSSMGKCMRHPSRKRVTMRKHFVYRHGPSPSQLLTESIHSLRLLRRLSI